MSRLVQIHNIYSTPFCSYNFPGDLLARGGFSVYINALPVQVVTGGRKSVVRSYSTVLTIIAEFHIVCKEVDPPRPPTHPVGVVKMSAVNALGGVRYEGSYEWVKFEGNAAIIAPPEAGTYPVTITARDAAGRSASVEVRVTLEAAGSFLLFADRTYLELSPSEAGTVTLTPVNASGDVRYTASEEWVTFAGNAAEIRPVEAGFYEVRITARDDGGRIAEVRIAVRVEAWEGEFSLTVPSSVEMVTTSTTVLAVSVQGARGEVRYRAEVSPAVGLEVRFEGVDAVYLTAEAPGTYTVRITAEDAGRQEGNTAAATITVNAAPGRGTAGSTGGGCGTGFGTITLGALVLLRVKRHKH